MRRLAALLALACVLAACGSAGVEEQVGDAAPPGTIELPPPGDTAAEADFLQAVEQRVGDFGAVPDQEMVELGRSVCTDLAGGETTEQVVAEVRDSRYGFGAPQAQAIVEAALEELCPDAA